MEDQFVDEMKRLGQKGVGNYLSKKSIKQKCLFFRLLSQENEVTDYAELLEIPRV